MNVCDKLKFTLTISKRYKIMKLKSVFFWRKRSHSQTCAAKVERFFLRYRMILLNVTYSPKAQKS